MRQPVQAAPLQGPAAPLAASEARSGAAALPGAVRPPTLAGDVLALQRRIGNRAVGALLAARAAPRPGLQRVIVADNLDQDVEYAKVKRFLVEKEGVPDRVAAPGQAIALTETAPDETIIVLQHGGRPEKGKPGTVMHWDPPGLLEVLGAMGFDPAKHTGDVRLMSCHSAYSRTGGKDDPSFAARLSALLKERGYTGTVSGVAGSLNPLGIGKPNEQIQEQSLWQGDPTFARLGEMDAALSRHGESLYVVQDYASGEATEEGPGWTDTMTGFLLDAVDAGEVLKAAEKDVVGFQGLGERIGAWRMEFFERMQRLATAIGANKGKKVVEAEDPSAIEDLMGTLLESRAAFDDLLREYREARIEAGYRGGFLGGLFAPLQMVEF